MAGSPGAAANVTGTTAPGSGGSGGGSGQSSPPTTQKPTPGVSACTVSQLSGQAGTPSSGDPSTTTITIQNNGSECSITGEGDITFYSGGSSVGDAKTNSGTTTIAAHGSVTSILSVPTSCNGDAPFASADSASFGVNGTSYGCPIQGLNVPMFANCPTSLSDPTGGV